MAYITIGIDVVFHTQAIMYTLHILVFLGILASIHGFVRPKPKFGPRVGRIVGGENTDITQVPWQLQLEQASFQFCAASIISENFALTAAHCTDGATAAKMSIRYGTSRHNSGGVVIGIASYAKHPLYLDATTDYDVTVLHLATPIVFSESAQPIALASIEPSPGVSALVSGWGVLTDGAFDQPHQLQSVYVTVVDREPCNEAYFDEVTERMICAGDPGKDSCQGDSGGPLVANNVQIGIVSWGYGCGLPGYPGIYTNVASLRSYIDENSNSTARWI